MEREMKDVGMTWVARSKKAQDRDVWRMFVCGVAYILTGVRGVRGNDDHLNTIAILLVIFPSRVGLADVA